MNKATPVANAFFEGRRAQSNPRAVSGIGVSDASKPRAKQLAKTEARTKNRSDQKNGDAAGAQRPPRAAQYQTI